MEELKSRTIASFTTQEQMLDVAERIAAEIFNQQVEDCLIIPWSPSTYTGKYNLTTKKKITYVEGRKIALRVSYFLNSIGA